MPKEKIRVAIYDKDYKIREMKKFEVTECGTKIRIKSGGEAHWMPNFDSDSFLEFKGLKRFVLFGARQWKRLYIIPRRGAKCVNFDSGKVTGPSIEELKKANKGVLLDKIGQGALEIPFVVYALLIVNTLMGFIALSALGVF